MALELDGLPLAAPPDWLKNYGIETESLGAYVSAQLEIARQMHTKGRREQAIECVRAVLERDDLNDSHRRVARILLKLFETGVPVDGKTISGDMMRNL